MCLPVLGHRLKDQPLFGTCHFPGREKKARGSHAMAPNASARAWFICIPSVKASYVLKPNVSEEGFSHRVMGYCKKRVMSSHV